MKIASLSLIFFSSAAFSGATTSSVESVLAECAKAENQPTLKKVIQHESGGYQFAVGINSKRIQLTRTPKNEDEAYRLVRWLEKKGVSFDLGYGQINSANLAKLGYTGENLRKAFDACENIKMSDLYYSDCLERSNGDIDKALSCYNTGDFQSGFNNGYVAKVNSVKDENIDKPDFVVEKKESPKGKKIPVNEPVRVKSNFNKKSIEVNDDTGKHDGKDDVFGTSEDMGVFSCNEDCEKQ